MKAFFVTVLFAAISLISFQQCAQSQSPDPAINSGKQLYIDVHQLGPGKVTFEAVAAAHAKDLEVQGKHGVKFMKYWVDEATGLIYCLSSAQNEESIRKTHAEAHGLLPAHIYPVSEGIAAALKGGKDLFLDTHELGAGKVTAKDVAGAHQKDLAVEAKYGVNFINYWVDEKDGVIICLSETADSNSVINTHREAHGLLPSSVIKVKQGE